MGKSSTKRERKPSPQPDARAGALAKVTKTSKTLPAMKRGISTSATTGHPRSVENAHWPTPQIPKGPVRLRPDQLFSDLSPEDQAKFRKWARSLAAYGPPTPQQRKAYELLQTKG